MDTSASITTGQNGIPLHCIICTRKPTFSDVSHLLTHISSKQHLSNYFRTKVKAIGDSNAKHSLDQFDEWYENWNIDDLLRDRMQQKDSKKRRTNGNRETSGEYLSLRQIVSTDNSCRTRHATSESVKISARLSQWHSSEHHRGSESRSTDQD